jgi:hypothetical protein
METKEKTYVELVGFEPVSVDGTLEGIWHCPKTHKVGLGRLPVRRGPKGTGKFCAVCGEPTTAGILPPKEKTAKGGAKDKTN